MEGTAEDAPLSPLAAQNTDAKNTIDTYSEAIAPAKMK
jgi:hypothetical protein